MSNSTAPEFAYSEPRARTLSRARAGRLPELLLVVAALTLFGLSLHQPWWFFKLYAPQYPRGLSLVIALDGLSGDVHEIDMLNHYIGMAHLDAAAAFERAHAGVLVAGLMSLILALALFVKRRGSALIALAGAAFPLGFLADSFYWLHRFGHELDPHAPLHIPSFTPQLFGNGAIGQFMTFAHPELGFWLACAGVALLAGASALHRVSPR